MSAARRSLRKAAKKLVKRLRRRLPGGRQRRRVPAGGSGLEAALGLQPSPAPLRGAGPAQLDIVLLWVDGNDPAYCARREQALEKLRQAGTVPEDKAVRAYRWSNHNEIIMALRSIEAFCPWARRVYIVTDNQTPPLGGLRPEFRDKVQVVDHRELFRGYTEVLPLFNSRSIETFVWRIPELAEHFVYFNDDMFALQPLSTADFFRDGMPLMRGKLVPVGEGERLKLHQNGMLNSARMLGFPEGAFFHNAHMPYALVKSRLEGLFERFRAEFERNISFRFRDRTQFKLVALLYHSYLLSGEYIWQAETDHMHLRERFCTGKQPAQIAAKLSRLNGAQFKFVCVNDMGALRAQLPEYERYFPPQIRLPKEAHNS